MIKAIIRGTAVGCSLLAAGLLTDGLSDGRFLIREAEARAHRPMTPLRTAGVARRTTRRMIRRTAIYVARLPAGCTTVTIDNTTLQQCDKTYYMPSGNQYVVVTVE